MRGLVLCLRRRLRADVIVTEIENKQFRVLHPVVFVCFYGKCSCYDLSNAI